MVIPSSARQNSDVDFNSRAFTILLLLILILAYVANFPFDSGEDVNNARANFQSSNRNDFWGGFAPYFYSLISDRFMDSNLFYAFLYLMLIGMGSFCAHRFLLRNERIYTPFRASLLLFSTLITSLFALQFSRDGTLLAFVWGSLGLLLWGYFKQKRILWILISAILFVIGMSFRPWLGLVSIPLTFFMLARLYDIQQLTFRRILFVISGSVALLLAPIMVDQAAAKFLNLAPSYPQQQVMIMDLSALTCLSANSSTVEESVKVLELISNAKKLGAAEICESFYPQSWASVVFYQKSNSSLQSPIRMINPSENMLYETFSQGWIRLILNHPKDYVQTKIMLSSQLLFAGDSKGKETRFLNATLMKPLNILRDLRLFSVLPFSFFLFFFTRRRRDSKSQIERLSIVVFYLVGTISVAVAFIGDNQRYLIPICLITTFLLIIQRYENRSAHE